VIRLKSSPIIDSSFKVEFGNATFQVDYQGELLEYADDTTIFNITIVSDTIDVVKPGDFVVFDKASSTDFYILPSTDVNAIDQFDPRKIGWFKPGLPTKVEPTLGNQIAIKLTDCDDAHIKLTYPWIKISDFLHGRSTFLSQSIAPGSILLDTDFIHDPSDAGLEPNHHTTPYVYLKDGWILMSPASELIFFGITPSDHFIPSSFSTPAVNRTVLTNSGIITADNWEFRTALINTGSGSTTIALLNSPDDAYWGVCMSTTNFTCVNQSITAMVWPEMVLQTIYFDGTFKKLHPSLNHNSSTIGLLESTQSGVYNILVEFRDLQIQFETTTVKAKISKIEPGLTGINITARSITTPGLCYIYTEPAGIVSAQSIVLGLIDNTNFFPYTTPLFTGNVTVGIRCHKNVVTQKIAVSYDSLISEQPTVTVDTETEWHHTLNPGNWLSSIGETLGGVGSWLGDAFGATGKSIKWWQHLLMWLEIVVFVILSVVVLYFIIKFVLYLYFMSRKYMIKRRLRLKLMKKEN